MRQFECNKILFFQIEFSLFCVCVLLCVLVCVVHAAGDRSEGYTRIFQKPSQEDIRPREDYILPRMLPAGRMFVAKKLKDVGQKLRMLLAKS